MKNISNTVAGIVVVLLLFIIYRAWFLNPQIIGGDFPYYYTETLADLPLFPPALSPIHGNGFGGQIVLYPLDSYLFMLNGVFVQTLQIPWDIVYKSFIFLLFIVLSFFSSLYLIRKIYKGSGGMFNYTGPLMYTANTYILMVTGGGQMGIALAYAVAPLVIGACIKFMSARATTKKDIAHALIGSVLAGFVLSVQLLFDLRIVFVTLVIVGLLFVYFQILHRVRDRKYSLKSFLISLTLSVIPIVICFLLHLYWILPLLFSKTIPIPQGYTNVAGLEFLSFASFPQTMSLLHPNWPENLFGKSYFMRPEFIALTIIAMTSLFFSSKSKLKQMTQETTGAFTLFFILILILGAFLSKGANEPFAFINTFLFDYVPGFELFRDPTKWYVLTAIAFSVLVPFSLQKISEMLAGIFKWRIIYIQIAVFLLFLTYYIVLILPSVRGELGGTFQKRTVPFEYVTLKDFISSDTTYFRTLWVPRMNRFTFHSYSHPAVEAGPYFRTNDLDEILRKLDNEKNREELIKRNIRYIIIPYDSLGEIFVEDRKYSAKQYNSTVKSLSEIDWIKKVPGYNNVVVYEIEGYQVQPVYAINSSIKENEIYYSYGRIFSLAVFVFLSILLIFRRKVLYNL